MPGPRIIIAGAPASGKGTQCELIKEKFGVIHLSTGDMLREAAAKGTEVGLLAKQYMEQGKLVPDEVIIGAVKERLAQPDCLEKGWLLDGFPRTGAQADALIEAGITADIFILLNVPDADLIERVVGRRADPVTGKIYHLKFSPPENDEIAARLTQRADDTEEKVKVRLQAYHDNLNAIIGKYEKIKVELEGTQNKHKIFEELAARVHSALPGLASASSSVLTSTPQQGLKGPKIVIAGAPASGKGTQCELIKEKFGVIHLSTGDMLREAAAKGTEVGLLAKQYMEQGKLVPDEVIIGAVKERLAQPDCLEKGWLLDGFPRTGAQADALIEAGITADIFILLNVPDADLIERVVGRRADPVTGKIYHLKFSPPENDEIAARLTQRADDTEEKVKVRLQAYHDNLNAIIGKYEKIKVELEGTQNKHKIFEELAALVHSALPGLASASSSVLTSTPQQALKGPKIVIAGAPASGKGTQCELIKEKFGVIHLSTGDMLREAAAKGTEVGLLAKQYMEQGKLVPDEVIIGAVKERLAQPDCLEKGWLLDGFPRTGAQADALIEAGITADVFILLNVPDADLIERVVGRRADPVTGKIYHLKFSPPDKEDILARLTQRADDTEEKVKVRVQAYHDNLNAIIGKYEKIKVELDGTQNKNRIFGQLSSAVYQIMPHLPGAHDPILSSTTRATAQAASKPTPLPTVPPSKGPKIVIAGAPASGKGTQCELIKEKFGVVHLSTGDMLRDAAAQGTKVGLLAKQYMEQGKLVPDDVIIRAVIERMCQPDCVEKGWLLDGFPRTGAQAGALEQAGAKADIFILLNVPDEDLIERVVGRRADPVTGKIYHLKFSPPESDEIQKRLTQRADDTEEKVKVRLQTYHDNLNAIIDFYGPCKTELDGTQDKHKVFDQLVNGVYAKIPSLRPAGESTQVPYAAANVLKIIIAGAPASGKGTQCELIKEKFGVVHLSTGDMLREAAAKGTEVGLLAKQYMEQGKLVPDEVIIAAVKERLAQSDCQQKGWLLDGFPRTSAQASALINEGISADIFIMLNVPDEDLIERVVGRRADPNTGKIYHLKFSPPENDQVRSRLTQRADDTEEKVKVRLEAFHTHMGGILGLYDNIVFRVDGTQGKTKIFETIKNKLEQLRKFEVVFVLGGPGCGKGTQCKRITNAFGYVHLSAGDLLRDERNSGSDLADMINTYIKEGKIVPAEVTIDLLRKAMIVSGKRRFLVDGFPRKLDNLEMWMELTSGESVVNMVLFFDCPEEVMEDRLLERGKTSGRSDDNIETIKKRFRTFKQETMPVIERLHRLGKVRHVSAVPPPDVVFASVKRIFEGVARVPLPDRTLAMIKPDAVYHGAAGAIIAAIEAEDFVIVGQIKRNLTKAEAETFYAEHRGKPFFERLINFMTSGPVIALALERDGALKAWRDLMGPTNSIKALEEAPNSIRARFGTDGTQNATHGSDSMANAGKELEFWFPDGYGRFKTLAMIKPFTANLHYEDIKSIILAHGFEIVAEAHQRLTTDRAGEFYVEHEGKDFFHRLLKYMTSDTVVALTLEREGAIRAWRMLAGPTNSITARREKPQSIRALYGYDGTLNAVHGSDSMESAQREVSFWFPKTSLKTGKSATAQLSNHQFPEMSAYMNQVVDPIVAPIILRALVQRPANFVNFCIDELREIQRVTDAPVARELPPVKTSSTPSPPKATAHGAGSL